MKKFTVLLIIFILSSVAYSNQNLINQQIQQTNNDIMLQGQLHHDREMRERAAAQQRQQMQPQPYVEPDIYDLWSAFVWNDQTGNVYYLPCSREEKGLLSKRRAIKRAEKHYAQIYGEKPNRSIGWECGLSTIAMGVSKKTGKIEAYVGDDIKGWIKKYGADNPNFITLVNQEALTSCSSQANDCELMYGAFEFPEDKQ